MVLFDGSFWGLPLILEPKPKGVRGKRGSRKSHVEYSAISIPLSILEEVDQLIEEISY